MPQKLVSLLLDAAGQAAIMGAEGRGRREENTVSGEETQEETWSPAELTLLTLARELEWAEAYAESHPDCRMGHVYLGFLRREMVRAQGDL